MLSQRFFNVSKKDYEVESSNLRKSEGESYEKSTPFSILFTN